MMEVYPPRCLRKSLSREPENRPRDVADMKLLRSSSLRRLQMGENGDPRMDVRTNSATPETSKAQQKHRKTQSLGLPNLFRSNFFHFSLLFGENGEVPCRTPRKAPMAAGSCLPSDDAVHGVTRGVVEDFADFSLSSPVKNRVEKR